MKIQIEHDNEWLTIDGTKKSVLEVLHTLIKHTVVATPIKKQESDPTLHSTKRTYTRRPRVRANKAWTKSELNWLRVHRGKYKVSRLAKELGRTSSAIMNKSHELDAPVRKSRDWPEEKKSE